MDEKEMAYRALVDTSMLNDRRDLQLSGLLRIMETTLEEHLLDIEMDNPRLIAGRNTPPNNILTRDIKIL